MSDRRTNIELLLKTLKEAYTDLALLKADLDDVEVKNRAKAERVRLDRKLNNETVKRRNRLDSARVSDATQPAPKRPVGRDASGLPSIGTGRAARLKIAEELREARTGEKPTKPEAKGLKVVKAERKPKAIKKAGAGGTKEDYEFGGKYTASGHLMQAGKAVGNMVSGMFGGSTVADSVNAKGAKTTAGGGNATQQADAGKARTDQE